MGMAGGGQGRRLGNNPGKNPDVKKDGTAPGAVPPNKREGNPD
jgi:hypothetical protein